MALKLDKYHRDYLFWIFPLIILGLLVFAIKRDNLNRESGSSSHTGFKADSSLTMSMSNRVPDSRKMTTLNDSTPLYYSTTRDN
jgi:hypothetical protein